MFFVDLIIQIVIAILIPYQIALAIYRKSKSISSWPFGVFFVINWVAQAYMAILFFHVFSSFDTWVCDTSVFILPIIGNTVFRKKYEAAKLHDVLAERAASDTSPPTAGTEIHRPTVSYGSTVAKPKMQIVQNSANTDMPIFCRKCRNRLTDGSLFCSQCGTKVVIERSCYACGKAIEESAMFCRFCGERQLP